MILEALVSPLSGENAELVRAACEAARMLIFGPETVAFCLSRNYWDIVVGLLDRFDEFGVKTAVLGTLCALAGRSDREQLGEMLARGFFEIIDEYIEDVLFAIPCEILDVFSACERSWEVGESPDWLELVFTPKRIACIEQLVEKGDRMPAGRDMSVTQVAQGILARIPL
jgi:hypothetical protein